MYIFSVFSVRIILFQFVKPQFSDFVFQTKAKPSAGMLPKHRLKLGFRPLCYHDSAQTINEIRKPPPTIIYSA